MTCMLNLCTNYINPLVAVESSSRKSSCYIGGEGMTSAPLIRVMRAKILLNPSRLPVNLRPSVGNPENLMNPLQKQQPTSTL